MTTIDSPDAALAIIDAEIEAMREDRDRAHAIVHAAREALVEVLRTKSFVEIVVKIRHIIGLIDEWKRQYAIADAIEKEGSS